MCVLVRACRQTSGGARTHNPRDSCLGDVRPAHGVSFCQRQVRQGGVVYKAPLGVWGRTNEPPVSSDHSRIFFYFFGSCPCVSPAGTRSADATFIPTTRGKWPDLFRGEVDSELSI